MKLMKNPWEQIKKRSAAEKKNVDFNRSKNDNWLLWVHHLLISSSWSKLTFDIDRLGFWHLCHCQNFKNLLGSLVLVLCKHGVGNEMKIVFQAKRAEEERRESIAKEKIESVSKVPNEPDPTDPDSVHVVFKLPCGLRLDRRFLKTHSLEVSSFIVGSSL